jgi:hypothetical protein
MVMDVGLRELCEFGWKGGKGGKVGKGGEHEGRGGQGHRRRERQKGTLVRESEYERSLKSVPIKETS